MRAECGKTHGQREKCDSRKEVYSPETREMIQMIDRLEENRILTGEEFIRLIDGRNHERNPTCMRRREKPPGRYSEIRSIRGA